MKSHTREALHRKIERTIKSANQVANDLYLEGVSDASLHSLEIDTERLADFCRFIRKQRIKKRNHREG